MLDQPGLGFDAAYEYGRPARHSTMVSSGRDSKGLAMPLACCGIVMVE
jgi:hypothetical protein